MVIDNKLNLGDSVIKQIKRRRYIYLQESVVEGIIVKPNGIEYLTNPPMLLSDKEVGETAFTSEIEWFDKVGDKIATELYNAIFICEFIKCDTKCIYDTIERLRLRVGKDRVDKKLAKAVKEQRFNLSDFKIYVISDNGYKIIEEEQFFNYSKYLTRKYSGIEDNRYYFTLYFEDVQDMEIYVEIKENLRK